MLWAVYFFSDLQRTLTKRLGLLRLAAILINTRQVGQGCRDVGVVLAERFLLDLQCPLIERFRLIVMAKPLIYQCHPFERSRGIGVVWTKRFLAYLQELGRKWERLRILSLFAELFN